MWKSSTATFQDHPQNPQQMLTPLKKHLIMHLLLYLISWMAQLCIGQSFWVIMTPLKITKIWAGDTPQRIPGQRLWYSAPSTLILYLGLPTLQLLYPAGALYSSNACLNLRHPKLSWCHQLCILWYRAVERESPLLLSSYMFHITFLALMLACMHPRSEQV